jgi:hypothetical protein
MEEASNELPAFTACLFRAKGGSAAGSTPSPSTHPDIELSPTFTPEIIGLQVPPRQRTALTALTPPVREGVRLLGVCTCVSCLSLSGGNVDESALLLGMSQPSAKDQKTPNRCRLWRRRPAQLLARFPATDDANGVFTAFPFVDAATI